MNVNNFMASMFQAMATEFREGCEEEVKKHEKNIEDIKEGLRQTIEVSKFALSDCDGDEEAVARIQKVRNLAIKSAMTEIKLLMKKNELSKYMSRMCDPTRANSILISKGVVGGLSNEEIDGHSKIVNEIQELNREMIEIFDEEQELGIGSEGKYLEDMNVMKREFEKHEFVRIPESFRS